jgi:hypothetical protein
MCGHDLGGTGVGEVHRIARHTGDFFIIYGESANYIEPM